LKLKKKWYKNMNIYTSIGLIIVFLSLGGFIKISPNTISGLIYSIILLGSAITSILFIVTRIIFFENFRGDG